MLVLAFRIAMIILHFTVNSFFIRQQKLFFYLLFLTHTFLYAIGKTWFLKNHFLPFTMSVMCIISYSVFNEHWFFSLSQFSLRFCIGFTVTQALACIPVKPIKWAQVDSNHRPRAYQARALTCWAMSPSSKNGGYIGLLVEINGIEPLTSCLQGRRSPSWAIPPFTFCMLCTL